MKCIVVFTYGIVDDISLTDADLRVFPACIQDFRELFRKLVVQKHYPMRQSVLFNNYLELGSINWVFSWRIELFGKSLVIEVQIRDG